MIWRWSPEEVLWKMKNEKVSYSAHFYNSHLCSSKGIEFNPELSWLTLNIDQKMWVGAWSSNDGDKPLNITRDNK